MAIPGIPQNHKTKACSKCQYVLDESSFYADSRASDGLSSACRVCNRQANAVYYLDPKNQEKRKEYNRANQRAFSLKSKFNLSLEEYNQMFAAQNGSCKICKKHQSEFNKALAVDHCHASGAIRGLLCGKCNRGLGAFNDDPNLFNAAMSYLRDSNGDT